MTYGYWFWLGVVCTAGALLLLLLTARKRPRSTRTVHAVVLFALLAFGGFKCARDEHQRTELLNNAPAAYTVGVTRGDESGMKFKEDKKRVEAVEYSYTIGGAERTGLGLLDKAYTIERDFYPADVAGKCALIQVVAQSPEINRLVAMLRTCPKTVPGNGWSSVPQEILDMVDTLWWRNP